MLVSFKSVGMINKLVTLSLFTKQSGNVGLLPPGRRPLWAGGKAISISSIAGGLIFEGLREIFLLKMGYFAICSGA